MIGNNWNHRQASAALAFIGRHSLPVYGCSIMLGHTWSVMPAITRATRAVAVAISLLIPPWIHQELRGAAGSPPRRSAGISLAGAMSAGAALPSADR